MANYFTDRAVQYPGRVMLTPVDGQADVYDMTREEGTVAEIGTPFNADTFNGIAQDIIDQIPDKSLLYYGTCETSQSDQTKIVTCSGFELTDGATVAVYFANGNTYTGTTNLNVNNTGDVPIQIVAGDTSGAFGLWTSGAVMMFVYSHSAWIPIGVDVSILATPSVSTSTGRLVDSNLTRMGRIRVLQLGMSNPNATGTSPNLNLFTGNIADPDRPKVAMAGVGYFGTTIVVLQVSASGNITARVIGQLAANSTVYCSVMYIV